jgi:hypothetical protein
MLCIRHVHLWSRGPICPTRNFQPIPYFLFERTTPKPRRVGHTQTTDTDDDIIIANLSLFDGSILTDTRKEELPT